LRSEPVVLGKPVVAGKSAIRAEPALLRSESGLLWRVTAPRTESVVRPETGL
jgi:hypothetical protein